MQRAELEEIYKEADFITLHCGLNEQTRSMIGAEQLRMMKSSAFLLNNAARSGGRGRAERGAAQRGDCRALVSTRLSRSRPSARRCWSWSR